MNKSNVEQPNAGKELRKTIYGIICGFSFVLLIVEASFGVFTMATQVGSLLP